VRRGLWTAVIALVVGVTPVPTGIGLASEADDPAAANHGISDDFNGAAVGGRPDGWAVESTADSGSVQVAAVPDGVNRSLRVRKTATAGETVVGRRSATPLTGTVQVEARAMVDSASGWFNILYVAGADRRQAASIAIRNGQFYDAGSGQYLMPAAAGRWYSVRAVLRTQDRRFDLYVDGQRVLANAAFREPTPDIGHVAVGIGAGQAGTVHLDSLRAHETPEPTVRYTVLDQFNGAATGSAPPGYDIVPAGGTATVAAVPGTADRSLRLTNAKAVRTFGAQTGKVITQATVRTDRVQGTRAALYAMSDSGQPAASIQFHNGTLRSVSPAFTGTLVGGVKAGEWYTIRLVLDVVSQTYEVYVDGRKCGRHPGQPAERPLCDVQAARPGVEPTWDFRSATATNIGQVLFDAGTGQGVTYADNVLVYRQSIMAPAGPVIDVRDHGAVGDGVTDDTAALQAALDAAEGSGGSVYLDDGVFLTGTIRLKSDTTLYIDDDAVLLGSQDDADYPRLTPAGTGTPRIGGNIEKALIYSAGADNVSIDGGGTIDGNGRKPEWSSGPERLRPAGLFLTTGRNVSVRNVSITDTGMWTFVPAEIDGLVIADVNIDNNLVANRGGTETVDCHNVLIERLNVWGDDDAIVFKSYAGGPANGIPGVPDDQRPFGVDNVTVRLSTVGRSERANGIKFGTASHGAFANVVVEDVHVKNVYHSGIVVEAIDGAAVSNLTFRRITMHGVGEPIFLLNGRRAEFAGPPRYIDTVRFEDISGGVRLTPIANDHDRRRNGSAISGQTDGGTSYRIYSLLFSNVDLTVEGGQASALPDPPEYTGVYPEAWMWKPPSYGYFFRHVNGLTMRDSSTTVAKPDVRQQIELRDVIR
jgi:hypothetical protein